MATKGQFTIPAEVRQVLQVNEGERIEFVQVIGAPVARKALEHALVDGHDITLARIVEPHVCYIKRSGLRTIYGG